VATADCVFMVLLVLFLGFLFFFLGWAFMVYLLLLVVVTLLLIPATLCTDRLLPTAEAVVAPYQWLITRPSQYAHEWHASAKASVRACVKPPVHAPLD